MLVGSLPVRAAAPADDLVKAELIAEPAAVASGEPLWVGLKLTIKDGWHVYWRNPGDSGEAVAIAWQLPAGYSAGPIAWPTPERIPVAHLVNFGYEHEAVLLTRISPPAGDERRRTGRHQGRGQLAGVPEGVHPGRGQPGAERPFSRPRHRRRSKSADPGNLRGGTNAPAAARTVARAPRTSDQTG